VHYVKGTKRKLTNVIETIAVFKAKHSNPSAEEIRDCFSAKKDIQPIKSMI